MAVESSSARHKTKKPFRALVAADVMSVQLLVAAVTDSVGGVLAKMIAGGVRHLPIVQNGALAGMVSDRDLRDAMDVLLADTERREAHPWDGPVSALMSSDVVSVEPQTGIGEIIDLMIDQKIGALPVVEPGSLKLVGIISYFDVLRTARQALT